ncbi:amidophosphoribosyltransferase [bacterium]|nr:amidophosphoribosyltransferase [bacterium]
MADPHDEHFKDECGVVGIFGNDEAANFAYLALQALQHRGQESAGIVSHDGERSYVHRDMGLVGHVFNEENLSRLVGHAAIGHVRYSTTGSSHIKNAQPFAVEYARGPIAIAHNGNLVNAQGLRNRLESEGIIFQSTTDTEVVTHLIARGHGDPVQRIIAALDQVVGAYSMVFLTENLLIAARDPRGWRPLMLGKKDGATVVASESCALALLEGEYEREVEPGEVLVIGEHGMTSYFPFAEKRRASCVFEFIYFARPDSKIFGEPVYPVRLALGRKLAEEHPADADLVTPVPDSGMAAALGYAEASGVPFQLGLVRSHYLGRTFIEPEQNIRHFGVRLKLSPNPAVIEGKRVILVDDSIVRGTTMRKIVSMIREAGAAEIHVRISSPPIAWPCYFGIDTPTREELVATKMTTDEIAAFLGADSLGYLSIEGMQQCLPAAPDTYCYACFDGRYPDQPEQEVATRQLALFEADEARA